MYSISYLFFKNFKKQDLEFFFELQQFQYFPIIFN